MSLIHVNDEFHTCQCMKRCFGMNIIPRCMSFITHFFLMEGWLNPLNPRLSDHVQAQTRAQEGMGRRKTSGIRLRVSD